MKGLYKTGTAFLSLAIDILSTLKLNTSVFEIHFGMNKETENGK
jgi:hypothetical protein